MSPPTYLQRVQQVFSDLAKAQQTSISWDAMLGRFTGEGQVCTPQVCRHVHHALRREILAHRVLKLSEGDDILIVLTPSGVQFYLAWGQLTLYQPDDPRFQRMTITELKRQSDVLRKIVRDICDTLLEYKPDLAPHDDVSKLPTFVSELIASVQDLEQVNFAWQRQRDDDEKERRALQARFRAGDSSGAK